jgi:hypothetical protein
MFLSKIGYYDGTNVWFARQLNRISELQVTSDSRHPDTFDL